MTVRKRLIVRSLVVLALALVVTSGATAAGPRPGSLDRRFGDGGRLGGQVGCVPVSVAGVERSGSGGFRVIGSTERSADDPVVEGGRLIIRGYDRRGRLDRDMVGGTGTVFVPLPGGRAKAFGVTRQRDGKLVVVGSVGDDRADSAQDVFVARFYPDGSLDAGFGGGGIVTTDLGGLTEQATDVVIQPDGRVVVAASGRFAYPGPYGDPSTELVVLRYLSDGTPDPGFASSGVLHVPSGATIGSAYFSVAGLGLERDGTIFVGGETGLTYRDSNTAAIARVRGDGSLDSIVRLGGDWSAVSVNAMSLDRKRGRIYLAGSMPRQQVGPERVMYAAAVRTEDLQLDKRFGVAGLAAANFRRAPNDGATSIISDRRGRVVLAGTTADEPPKSVFGSQPASRFAVARFTAAGKLDRRFGRRGLAQVRFPYRQSVAEDVIEHPAGRLVVAGVGAGVSTHGYPPTGCSLAVTRLAAR